MNESGSVWGGTTTLVEEASIGVDTGADEYMLGSVSSLAVTGGHIVVADSQVPAVRVYDMTGRYIRDVGREGQGPGEYGYPGEVGVQPGERIVVKDGNRILIFSIEGESIASWTVGQLLGFSMIEMPLVVTTDGTPYAPVVVDLVSPDSGTWKWGMLPVNDEGEAGEPVRVPPLDGPAPLRLRIGDNSFPVPFAPELVWAFTPIGSMIVGNSAAYAFEVHDASGAVLAIKHAAWQPVRVDPAEARWHREETIARMRRSHEGWVWNGPDIPATKPAYQRLMPDRSGRIWVNRAGRGKHATNCLGGTGPDAECWRDDELLEVFGPEGRFLGSATPPAGLRYFPRPFIRDDMFVGVIEDEAGTIMVKRYRLVLPGEE